MSHKNLAIGTVVVLFSFAALLLFLNTFCIALQRINPIAALTAITVALIGIVWFKRTNK